MVSTLVVGTNTFALVATADAYHEDSIADSALTWATTGADDKARALITAARMFGPLKWEGALSVSTQPLAFPRTGLTDCAGAAETGTPQAIIEAQLQLAALLIVDPSIAASQSTASNVKRAKAGSAEVEFFRSGGAGGIDSTTRLPFIVHELLTCYLSGNTGAVSSGSLGSYSTGTDECSQQSDFDADDFYPVRLP